MVLRGELLVVVGRLVSESPASGPPRVQKRSLPWLQLEMKSATDSSRSRIAAAVAVDLVGRRAASHHRVVHMDKSGSRSSRDTVRGRSWVVRPEP